ncbi:MAG: hypothetical protein QOH67_1472 [Hyphomicrobiales bacterium]|jgi:hypothetical protein|nr:hypothetical protein [Hyphomicrobiales bacterium]
MEANTDERLEQAVATLNGLIEMMRANGRGDSVLFLEMAKLQVQLDLHGITDEEFIALCDALDNGTLRPVAGTEPPPSYPRPRREGDLRGQRRAWQCPPGAARGRRSRAKQ